MMGFSTEKTVAMFQGSNHKPLTFKRNCFLVEVFAEGLGTH
jgi:hypothetical protein